MTKFLVKDACQSGSIEIYRNGQLARLIDFPTRTEITPEMLRDALLQGIAIAYRVDCDPDSMAPWKDTPQGWVLTVKDNGNVA